MSPSLFFLAGVALAGAAGAAECPGRPSGYGFPWEATRVRSETLQASLQDWVQLLQAHSAPPKRSAAPPLGPQRDDLQKVLPVAWFHVPKSGTSFLNTIVHLPGVCPGIPDDFLLDRCNCDEFPLTDAGKNCTGMSIDVIGHRGLEEEPALYEQRKGRYMTLLRDPEQRILSAYDDLLWDSQKYEGDWEYLISPRRPWGGLAEKRIPNASELAYRTRGCAVKMLTRAGWPCGDDEPPTQAEMQEAKARLATDFSFVGLTDEWALSICLLSARFSVPCLPAMMDNIDSSRHPAIPDASSPAEYDVASLGGVTDPFDRELLEEATSMFRAGLARYNVTEAWCRQTCWKDAGII